MRNLIKNWKTTSTGIIAILGGAILVVKGQIVEGVAAIAAGVGQLAAKDSTVTGK